MPGYDKKGPDGEGPNTGRGLGYCTGYKKKDEEKDIRELPKFIGRGRGRGLGRGPGRGLGRGRRGAFFLEEIESPRRGLEEKTEK